MDPTEISELISEAPGIQPAITRVRHALSKANNPALHGPRTHGSKIYLGDESIGLFDAIDGLQATETHTRDEFTYLVFPIKKECSVAVNAVPSYLLPPTTKVGVAISPKGTPQVVADDKVLGAMDPSGDLVVILGYDDRFITWFPMSEGEEPWEMTALTTIPDHLGMAKIDRIYRVSTLESYLGGAFSVVKKSKVFKQQR
jgi:hypothetical protein